MKTVFFLSFLLASDLLFASVRTARMLSHYQITVPAQQSVVVSQNRSFQLGVINSRVGKSAILGVDHQPISIRTAIKYAAADGVNSKNLKIKRNPASALFYYETPDVVKIYSTLGGHLSIAKRANQPFSFNQVVLIDNRKKVGKR